MIRPLLVLLVLAAVVFNPALCRGSARIVASDFTCEGECAEVDTDAIRGVLMHHLAQLGVTMLERDNLALVLRDHSLSQQLPSLFDPDSAMASGGILEASHTLFGEVISLEDRRYVLVRLVSVATTKFAFAAIEAWPDANPESQVSTLRRLAQRTAAALNMNQRDLGYLHVEVVPPPRGVRGPLSMVMSGGVISGTLPAGYHPILIESATEVHLDSLLVVNVLPNDTTRVTVRLPMRRGTIEAPNSTPGHAIYIDGEFVGEGGTISSAIGSHKLMIVDGSGSVRIGPVVVAENQNTPIDLAALEPAHRNGIAWSIIRRDVMPAVKSVRSFYNGPLAVTYKENKQTKVRIIDVLTGEILTDIPEAEAFNSPSCAGITYTGAPRRASHLYTYPGALDWHLLDAGVESRPLEVGSGMLFAVSDTSALVVDSRGRHYISLRTRDVDWRLAQVCDLQIVATSRGRDRVLSFDLESGDLVWTAVRPDTRVVAIAVCDRGVGVGTSDGVLALYDQDTGDARWVTRLPGLASLSATGRGSIFVTTDDGSAVSVDLDTGRPVSRPTSTLPRLKRILDHHDGRIVFESRDDTVGIYDTTSNTLLWSDDVNAGVVDAAVLGSAAVVALSDESLITVGEVANWETGGWVADVDSTTRLVSCVGNSSVSEDWTFISPDAFDHDNDRCDRSGVLRSVVGGHERILAEVSPGSRLPKRGDLLIRSTPLAVTTTPREAIVWVDGRLADRGRVTVGSGSHSIVASCDGYQPQSWTDVELLDRVYADSVLSVAMVGGVARLNVDLVRSEPAIVTVDGEPWGADVYVNGGRIGTAPVTLRDLSARQRVDLRVKAGGYRHYRSNRVVLAGEPNWTYNLEVPGLRVISGGRWSLRRSAIARAWRPVVTSSGPRVEPGVDLESDVAAVLRCEVTMPIWRRSLFVSVVGDGLAGLGLRSSPTASVGAGLRCRIGDLEGAVLLQRGSRLGREAPRIPTLEPFGVLTETLRWHVSGLVECYPASDVATRLEMAWRQRRLHVRSEGGTLDGAPIGFLDYDVPYALDLELGVVSTYEGWELGELERFVLSVGIGVEFMRVLGVNESAPTITLGTEIRWDGPPAGS